MSINDWLHSKENDIQLVKIVNDKNPDQDANDSKVIFFLGAGASKEAGIPTMFEFVDAFEQKTKANAHIKKQECLNLLLSHLKEWKQKNLKGRIDYVDLELLMEALWKGIQHSREVLNLFFDTQSFKFNEYQKELEELYNDLVIFIREKCVVDEKSLNYLKPLKDFIIEFAPFEIYTTNYDLAIEKFCTVYEISYTDGFELYWAPQSYDQNYQLKLFKLHGSVMWYKTNRSAYLKIPVDYSKHELPGKIELLTGEIAENLMVYPIAGKESYTKPLASINDKFRKKLEEIDVCAVIGYSFRDEYIKEIFKEAFRVNGDLILLLVAPDASKICKYELSDTLFEGKVIPINLGIGQALADRFLFKVIQNYRDAKYQEAVAEQDSRRHIGRYDWSRIAQIYSYAGHFYKAAKIVLDNWIFELQYSENGSPRMPKIGSQELQPFELGFIEQALFKFMVFANGKADFTLQSKLLNALQKIFEAHDELINTNTHNMLSNATTSYVNEKKINLKAPLLLPASPAMPGFKALNPAYSKEIRQVLLQSEFATKLKELLLFATNTLAKNEKIYKISQEVLKDFDSLVIDATAEVPKIKSNGIFLHLQEELAESQDYRPE